MNLAPTLNCPHALEAKIGKPLEFGIYNHSNHSVLHIITVPVPLEGVRPYQGRKIEVLAI